MGTCSTLIRSSAPPNSNDQLRIYPRHCTVNIKSKEVSATSESTPYNISLTDPIHLRLDPIFVNEIEIVASQCVLPGIDPRGIHHKKCQDSCLILHNSNSLFLALFDGHGSEGITVVNFCALYVERYYNNLGHGLSINDKENNPKYFLTTMTETCDQVLAKMQGKIDSNYSGP